MYGASTAVPDGSLNEHRENAGESPLWVSVRSGSDPRRAPEPPDPRRWRNSLEFLLSRTKKSLALAACAGLAATTFPLFSPAVAQAATGNCGDTTAGVTIGTGTEGYLAIPINQANIKAQALAEVVKWRMDALNSPERLWNGQTMLQALAAKGMSEAAYLNPQWDYDLERIAIQRSAEVVVQRAHQRPNGTGPFEVAYNGQTSMAEVLAWDYPTQNIVQGISAWASEKADLVNNTGGVTGHYLFLIDPDQLSYGFGNTNFTSSGEGSPYASSNTASTNWSGSCAFRIPLLTSTAKLTYKVSPTSAVSGQTKAVTTTGVWNTVDLAGEPLTHTFDIRGTLTSANTAVATASGRNVFAAKPGTSALSVASGDQTVPMGSFTVVARAITSVANPAVITTASGKAPVMPTTVVATWNDGTTSTQSVTWGAIPTTWKNRAGGTFTVSGTVAGTTKTITSTINVTPAFVTSSTAQTAKTPAGIAPTLPTTVPVVWSNGDTSSEAVVWDAIPTASYGKQGVTFAVAGTVKGKKVARTNVSVTAPIVRSVERPALSILATRRPTLPVAVAVVWSDGTTTQQSVGWATVDPSWYDRAGSVKVGGIVTLPDGTTTTTDAVITVRTIGFSPASGMLPLATNLIGESTGDAVADVWGLTPDGALDFHRKTPTGVEKVGLRGEGLEQISYLGVVPDQNGDKRADLFYRDSTDQSLWFAYNQGNGYLTKGVRVGQRWGQMDQIFYAGNMITGSNQQFILARNRVDGSLWRYAISPTGMGEGVKVGRGWGDMRIMVSPGNMYGDAAWDVVAIHKNGNLYGYKNINGGLADAVQAGRGWGAITTAFSPGDITNDGRLDLIARTNTGDLYAYNNTTTGWGDLGKIGSGFNQYKIMA